MTSDPEKSLTLQPSRSSVSVEHAGSVTSPTVTASSVASAEEYDAAARRGEDDDFAALTPQRSRASSRPPLSRKVTSIGIEGADPAFEVDWGDENDAENPTNWPFWYKCLVIAAVSFGTIVVVLYSTAYTAGIPNMEVAFNISSEPVVTLGVTVYLVGLAVGSLILAPLSEVIGRKPVYVVMNFVYMVLIIPCGFSTSLTEVLLARFFGAIAGSAMIANAPGTINDIITEEYRALAFSIWSLGPLLGPVLGPVAGGFVTQYLGFRWVNWIVMMLAFVSWLSVCAIKETYPPALLTKRAAKKRKTTGDTRWWCRYEQRASLGALVRLNLTRPFIMAVTEPICIFWNFYIAVIYGILYMCFVAYPIVFTEIRGWSLGISGLSFSGLGVGSTITVLSEPLLRRWVNRHPRDPETGRVSPEATVSIVCVAAFLAPIGQMWFAWTCTPPVHWIVPILAGVPLGMGNSAVFIYATSYLTGSYGIYTASALAGNSVVRSMLGGTLPLAGPAMYDRLGPHWASSLLGFLQILIIPIPFVFYRYGGAIRARSTLISRMRADKQRLDGGAARRAARRRAAEAAMEAGEAGAGAPVQNEKALELDLAARALAKEVEQPAKTSLDGQKTA